MKILHYIPSIDEKSGGVGAYMQLLARDLGKLCELHVVTHRGDEERKLENCKVHYISTNWCPWNNCKQEFLILLNKLHPDVFHTNSCWTLLSSLTAQWAKSAGYKVVYTPHGMLEPYALLRHFWTKKLPAILLFQKKGLRVSDMIHATAEMEKENLLKLGWNKNVTVVPNCIQIDQILSKYPDSLKGKEYVRCRSKMILFLSRVHPKKGVNFLIEAIARLKNELKGFTVKVAGPGEDAYLNELKALAEAKGVGEMIHFLGPVFGDAKWPLYREADVFVLPTYSENFGIVIAEALASGTPVITTFGTPWEELNHFHCGWCTDIGTEPTVEALLKFLTCSDIELQEMGRRGRKLVEDKYTSVAIAKQFYEMYQQLANQGLDTVGGGIYVIKCGSSSLKDVALHPVRREVAA